MNAPPFAAHQAESSALKPKWVMREGKSEPVDLHLMLQAWNSGSPAARDVALQMADIDRKRAMGANNGDAR